MSHAVSHKKPKTRRITRVVGALLLACAAGLLAASPAHAHKPSDSYLTINVDSPTLTARWDLAVKDLEFLVGLDIDRDGQVTWGELQARQDEVVSVALGVSKRGLTPFLTCCISNTRGTKRGLGVRNGV